MPFASFSAEAHARLDEDAVGLVAHDRNRRHVGDRKIVEPAHGRAAESAAGRLGEVVVLGGLVVDGGDPAVRIGAERVLRGRVGVSARIRNRRRDGLDDADVQGLAVRLAQHLVERAVVGGVQRARGAVGGHAGVAGGGVDVAWAFRPGRSNVGSRPGLLRHRQRGANQRERQCEHRYKIDSRFHAQLITTVFWCTHFELHRSFLLGRDQLILLRIQFDADVLVFIEQSGVIHLQSNRADPAGVRSLKSST